MIAWETIITPFCIKVKKFVSFCTKIQRVSSKIMTTRPEVNPSLTFRLQTTEVCIQHLFLFGFCYNMSVYLFQVKMTKIPVHTWNQQSLLCHASLLSWLSLWLPWFCGKIKPDRLLLKEVKCISRNTLHLTTKHTIRVKKVKGSSTSLEFETLEFQFKKNGLKSQCFFFFFTSKSNLG